MLGAIAIFIYAQANEISVAINFENSRHLPSDRDVAVCIWPEAALGKLIQLIWLARTLGRGPSMSGQAWDDVVLILQSGHLFIILAVSERVKLRLHSSNDGMLISVWRALDRIPDVCHLISG